MMTFFLRAFSDLNTTELYRLLQIRTEVFVVEQDCVYQDIDGKDIQSHHVLGYVGDRLQACTRIVPPGLSYADYVSIGRVLTTKDVRRDGYGRELMRKSVEYCKLLYPAYDIKISAQTYLLKFYNDLGFHEVGEGYLEDGIPHVAMVLINN